MCGKSEVLMFPASVVSDPIGHHRNSSLLQTAFGLCLRLSPAHQASCGVAMLGTTSSQQYLVVGAAPSALPAGPAGGG